MSRREEILSDDVHLVRGYITKKIETNNGIALKEDEENAKIDFFNFSTRHLLDELLQIKKTYPKGGTTDITVNADFVVMKRKEFDELINLKDE